MLLSGRSLKLNNVEMGQHSGGVGWERLFPFHRPVRCSLSAVVAHSPGGRSGITVRSFYGGYRANDQVVVKARERFHHAEH